MFNNHTMLTWTNLRIFSVKLISTYIRFVGRGCVFICRTVTPIGLKSNKRVKLELHFSFFRIKWQINSWNTTDKNLVRWHHLQNKLSLIGKSHLHMLTDSTAYLPLHHLEQLVPVARDLSKELKASLKIFRQITCLQWKSTLFTHKNFVSWTFWQKCVRFSSMWERLIFLGSSMNKNKVARGRRS